MSLEDRCSAPDGEHFATRVASTKDEQIKGQEARIDEMLAPQAAVPVAPKIATLEAAASPDIHGETSTTTPLLLPLESGLTPADTESAPLFLEVNSNPVPDNEQEDMEVSVGTDGGGPSEEHSSPGAVTRTTRERDTGGEPKIGELTLRPLSTQPQPQIVVRRRWEEGDTRLLNATMGDYFEELQVKNLKPKQNEVVKILRRDNLTWLMDSNGITRTMEKVRVEFKRFLRGSLD